MLRVVVGLMLVAGVLSGCVGDESPPSAGQAVVDLAFPDLSWTELGGLVFQPDHVHVDRDLHQEILRNVTLVSRSTLSDDGVSQGQYIEADVEGGLMAVAITIGASVDTRVMLLDRAALPKLVVLGSFDVPGAYGDVKLDADRPLVYVPYRSPGAFSIWDVSDPSSPRRIGEAPVGTGCHMLHPMTVAGTSYVWCTDSPGAVAYRIVDLPDGTLRGVPVSTATWQSDPEVLRYNEYYADLTQTGMAAVFANHDMTAQSDPLTGDPILVTAHELQGIRVYDVSIPEIPRELSAWRGEGMMETMERVHTAALVNIDERRIAIGMTETFAEVPPAMYIVDMTDYANPVFLSRWVPPGVDHDDGLIYSLHNFQVVGTRLYLTNFHAGFWVLDIADPANPQTFALRTPVWDTGYPRPDEQAFTGFFNTMDWYWDVIVVDGYAIVTDGGNGVEVLLVDGDPAGDAAWTGFT